VGRRPSADRSLPAFSKEARSSRTERTLPLRVTPRPEALVRVMVGRHDLLPPERERDVERPVKES
jgi:hypothetical protein